MDSEFQRMAKIISVLVEKLGGKVTVEETEISESPYVTVTRDSTNGTIIIEVEKS